MAEDNNNNGHDDHIAGIVHSGVSRSEQQTMIFNIHGFEDLPAKPKHRTPSIFCNGYAIGTTHR